MLLANMATAHKIYKTFPQLAVLRRHPAPQTRMTDELVSNRKPRDGTGLDGLEVVPCHLVTENEWVYISWGSAMSLCQL